MNLIKWKHIQVLTAFWAVCTIVYAEQINGDPVGCK